MSLRLGFTHFGKRIAVSWAGYTRGQHQTVYPQGQQLRQLRQFCKETPKRRRNKKKKQSKKVAQAAGCAKMSVSISCDDGSVTMERPTTAECPGQEQEQNFEAWEVACAIEIPTGDVSDVSPATVKVPRLSRSTSSAATTTTATTAATAEAALAASASASNKSLPFRFECASCGTVQNHTLHDIDHKWPRFMGGADIPPNRHLLCTPCHRVKSIYEQRVLNPMRRKIVSMLKTLDDHGVIDVHTSNDLNSDNVSADIDPMNMETVDLRANLIMRLMVPNFSIGMAADFVETLPPSKSRQRFFAEQAAYESQQQQQQNLQLPRQTEPKTVEPRRTTASATYAATISPDTHARRKTRELNRRKQKRQRRKEQRKALKQQNSNRGTKKRTGCKYGIV